MFFHTDLTPYFSDYFQETFQNGRINYNTVLTLSNNVCMPPHPATSFACTKC